jgi:hypothetical protein
MTNEYVAVGGMGIGKENQSTQRKPAPGPLCQEILHDLLGIEPWHGHGDG